MPYHDIYMLVWEYCRLDQCFLNKKIDLAFSHLYIHFSISSSFPTVSPDGGYDVAK